MWLSRLSAGLQTKELPAQFLVRAHAWVAGQAPSGECPRGNHTLKILSRSVSFPSPHSKNKYIKLKKKKKENENTITQIYGTQQKQPQEENS